MKFFASRREKKKRIQNITSRENFEREREREREKLNSNCVVM
jgi:hypothetical protein